DKDLRRMSEIIGSSLGNSIKALRILGGKLDGGCGVGIADIEPGSIGALRKVIADYNPPSAAECVCSADLVNGVWLTLPLELNGAAYGRFAGTELKIGAVNRKAHAKNRCCRREGCENDLFDALHCPPVFEQRDTDLFLFPRDNYFS